MPLLHFSRLAHPGDELVDVLLTAHAGYDQPAAEPLGDLGIPERPAPQVIAHAEAQVPELRVFVVCRDHLLLAAQMGVGGRERQLCFKEVRVPFECSFEKSLDFAPARALAVDGTARALPAGQILLRKLADVGELRVDHLRATCLRHLSQQHIRLRARPSVLFLEPIDHLYAGDAEGIVKRAGATHGAYVGRRLDARLSQSAGRRRK